MDLSRASLAVAVALAGAVWCSALRAEDRAARVSVVDGGVKTNAATWECTSGHKVEKRSITLDSGKRRYTFLASGCTDPSHGEKRPCSEGNFGMPEPISANWYWGGFLRVLVNGENATAYRIAGVQVLENGARGSFQILWAHPDADVGLRLLMLPEANHVLAHLTWKAKPGVALKTVAVHLTCYPSFFTAARHRTGERHCRTPRTDLAEPKVLDLVPDKDTFLYYYDTVFDVAKGEGDGPCAALVAPAAVAAGRVRITGYPVITELDLKPEAGEARLAFYDFAGRKNAEAEAYMTEHGERDLAELIQADFRPELVRRLDLGRLKSEAAKLLADAGDDGKALQPKIEEMLFRTEALKAQADGGDWGAEASLAAVLQDSSDLFWRLRTFAALNAP
jgi:hypothetical protein